MDCCSDSNFSNALEREIHGNGHEISKLKARLKVAELKIARAENVFTHLIGGDPNDLSGVMDYIMTYMYPKTEKIKAK